MLSKKHFKKAAEIVSKSSHAKQVAVFDAFVEFFQEYNERFDTCKFADACWPEGNTHGITNKAIAHKPIT